MKNKMYLFLLGLGVVVLAALFIANEGMEAQGSRSEVPEPVQQPATESASGAAPQATALIVSGEPEAQIWTRKTPAAHRARIIHPDKDLLSPKPKLKAGDQLELAFFADAFLSSTISDVTTYPNGAVGMTARLDGDFKGLLYLSYSGGELRAHADIFGGNDFYVRYDPDLQAHVAIEIDRENSDYQEECETCASEQEQKQLEEFYGGEVAANEVEEGGGGNPVALAALPDSVVVDIMVVYTPAALSYEGGTNGINNNIALAVQKANTAHGNSNTKMTMNLVHSAETSYTESGSGGTDLDNLTFVGGSYSAMDEVHGLRNTNAADMVCLFEFISYTGGIGWLMDDTDGRPDRAFCVGRVQQTSWTFTMVHEFGHNMGCSHSKTQASQPWDSGDLYSYSAGWQWADASSPASIGYCSLMTYENFDGNSGNGDEYQRVGHFSNPSINYIGSSTNATGHVSDGDNARTIRNARHLVSEYRFPVSKIDQFPSTNDFEIGFSPWTYYTADERDWVLNTGSTPSGSTGPSGAYEGSRYGHIEASFDGEGFPSKTGILQAEFDFSGVVDPQIDYAYHMYGEAMGSLYLEASTNSGGSWTTLWSMSGNQGTSWLTNQVDLSAYEGNSSVYLRFRGVTGSNFTSDMALDSIVVSVDTFDSDGDGIPNYWETLYFGGPTNAVATANPDSDKYNNLLEYIAGLNPTNSDGLFLTNLTVGAGSAFEWSSASGRIYSVYWTDDLLTGFTILQSNLTSGIYTDTTHAAESEGFYKLEVRLAP